VPAADDCGGATGATSPKPTLEVVLTGTERILVDVAVLLVVGVVCTNPTWAAAAIVTLIVAVSREVPA